MILSPDDCQLIYQNVSELIRSSQSLLTGLLEKRKTGEQVVSGGISDAFEDIRQFYPLKSYCIGHSQAIERLSHCLRHDRKFVKFVEEAQSKPECLGLDLASFLLEPVQRIARYPLLLRQIIHYTDSELLEDHRGLRKAINRMEGLLMETNEAVREAENWRTLSRIQNRLNWSATQSKSFSFKSFFRDKRSQSATEEVSKKSGSGVRINFLCRMGPPH